MRLGFDLDGTLADMQTALAREARLLFPQVDPDTLPKSSAPDGDGAPADPPESEPAEDDSRWSPRSLSARQQRQLWKTVCSRENFWETLDELEPGAIARLARVVRTRKWELIFLTSRPETAGDTAQLQSHRWLTSHGCPEPSVFVVHGSRGKICAALDLDVLVDDRPENCLDVAIDSSARPILVWRGAEAEVPASARQLGIGVVASIASCLDILEQLDQEEVEPAGMVDRLKRLLGLKPRARSRDAIPRPIDDSTATPADAILRTR